MSPEGASLVSVFRGAGDYSYAIISCLSFVLRNCVLLGSALVHFLMLGFYCGDAVDIATTEWLSNAKEAAIHSATIKCPPMVSHFQLSYDLALSLCSRGGVSKDVGTKKVHVEEEESGGVLRMLRNKRYWRKLMVELDGAEQNLEEVNTELEEADSCIAVLKSRRVRNEAL
ncbi:UNVERIFIED_CONTAM: Lysine-specific demethylase [Sesamum calycinum]|uniref:Lysine-specific demethylase n=1 Tax=Sesamum calycinum TaxID=2727403 RepID=A0AAW2JZ71_9LAMI